LGVSKCAKPRNNNNSLSESLLSRTRSVLESFIEGFSGTIVCDGYSAYDKVKGVSFANCWAHVRHYWLKADSKNGQIGFCYGRSVD
jgi:transposase